jgi:Fic family protein
MEIAGMAFNRKKPYNNLPPLPPKIDVETKPVLKKTASAARALAELKGLGGIIPNQSMLVNSLILQEAKASSEIENIVTTNDALFQAMAAGSSSSDPAIKEVLRYREALWMGFNRLEENGGFDPDLLIDLVQAIKQDSRGIRNKPGTFIGNSARRTVTYTPPDGEVRIRIMLQSLTEYMNLTDDTDPLIKLALSHYQFEAIHPFFDGNGRTGRLLNSLFLVHHGLLELPVLYLSKKVIETKTVYYRLLRNVTEKKDWEPWILYMLDAVETTASFTRKRIVRIRKLLDETIAQAKDKLPSRVYSKELIEVIFRQPYTKGKFVVDSGIAQRQTAAEYLNELETAGFLEKHKVGRENLYLNRSLFDLLSK